MTVKEYLTPFLEIDENTTVKDAAVIMGKHGTGSALATRNNLPVGVVTERDFLKNITAKGLDASKTAIREIMSYPIATIGINDKIKDAAILMDKKNIRRLAVVDEKGKIIGKITAHGISRGLGFQKIKKEFTEHPHDYYIRQ